MKKAEPYLESGDADDGQIGHDFFLTRNGHGAGFWDGAWDVIDYHSIHLNPVMNIFIQFISRHVVTEISRVNLRHYEVDNLSSVRLNYSILILPINQPRCSLIILVVVNKDLSWVFLG